MNLLMRMPLLSDGVCGLPIGSFQESVRWNASILLVLVRADGDLCRAFFEFTGICLSPLSIADTLSHLANEKPFSIAMRTFRHSDASLR
jgi:hypothetical protein